MDRTVTIQWRGREYVCRPTFEALMRIEERVPIHVLAGRVQTNPTGIPWTHVQWVLYCLLHAAGAQAEDDGVLRPISAPDVFEDAASGGLDLSELSKVVLWLLGHVFGVGPKETDTPSEGKSEA